MDNRPIGVFDSGIGGLSILRELEAVLPHENYVFLADQSHVPYGEKSKAQLENLSGRISRFLLRHDAKLIVVACNTATCYAIKHLRSKFSVPFIGTVPAIKPAVEQTKTKIVAVISTPATAKSPALKDLVRQFASHATVLRIGCPGLEDAVELGNIDSPETTFLLKKYLAVAMDAHADQIVLGCTHYPFLKNSIRSIVGPNEGLVDSGQAIAHHTASILSKLNLLSNTRQSGHVQYFTTGSSRNFSRVASKLLGKKIVGKRVKI